MRAFTPRATSASPDVATRARHARSRAPRIAPHFSAHIPPRRLSRAHRPRRADHPSRARARYDAHRRAGARIAPSPLARARDGGAAPGTPPHRRRIVMFASIRTSRPTRPTRRRRRRRRRRRAHTAFPKSRESKREGRMRARASSSSGVCVCACATTTRRGDWKIQKKTRCSDGSNRARVASSSHAIARRTHRRHLVH